MILSTIGTRLSHIIPIHVAVETTRAFRFSQRRSPRARTSPSSAGVGCLHQFEQRGKRKRQDMQSDRTSSVRPVVGQWADNTRRPKLILAGRFGFPTVFGLGAFPKSDGEFCRSDGAASRYLYVAALQVLRLSADSQSVVFRRPKTTSRSVAALHHRLQQLHVCGIAEKS
jgi:hypothetical protein